MNSLKVGAADAVRAMWEKHMIEIECDTSSRVASTPGLAVFLFFARSSRWRWAGAYSAGLEHLVLPRYRAS